jgi:hypothetical protein
LPLRLSSRKQTMVYVQKSRLACPATKTGEIPFIYPLFCLTNSVQTSHTSPPRPSVELYRLKLRSVNPCLCPNLGIRRHQVEARIGGHTIIILRKFNGRGATFSILGFLRYANRNFCSYWGSILLLLLSLRERMMIGVMRRK